MKWLDNDKKTKDILRNNHCFINAKTLALINGTFLAFTKKLKLHPNEKTLMNRNNYFSPLCTAVYLAIIGLQQLYNSSNSSHQKRRLSNFG